MVRFDLHGGQAGYADCYTGCDRHVYARADQYSCTGHRCRGRRASRENESTYRHAYSCSNRYANTSASDGYSYHHSHADTDAETTTGNSTGPSRAGGQRRLG